MKHKEHVNFIGPEIQWGIWYIRYKTVWWTLLVIALLGFMASVAICTKTYIQYQDRVTAQLEVQSHHIDATSDHALYDAMVHLQEKKQSSHRGTLQECLYLLDAANTYHIQLLEWSTLDQWYVEARGVSESELHQFSTALGRLGGHRHYDEVVEKESGSTLYRSRITGTVEGTPPTQKNATHTH